MDLLEEKVPKTRGCSSRCELEPKLKFHLVPTALAVKSPRGPVPPIFLRKHVFCLLVCFVLTLPPQTLDSGLYRIAHFLASRLLHL